MRPLRIGLLSVFLITAALLAVRMEAGPIAGIISKRSTANFASAAFLSFVALLAANNR